MRKYIFLALFIFVISSIANAKNYNLTLAQSIDTAKAKSLSMQSYVQQFKIAQYNLKSETSKFKTHISMNLDLPHYEETVNKFQDSTGISYYPINQLNYQGIININKQLITDGSIYIRSFMNNYDDFYSKLRLTYLNTQIGFNQPLDALYGYNATKSSLKKAQLNYESARKQLKRNELDLIYNVTNAFYNALKVQKQADLARQNLARQKDAYEISKNKYAAGLIRQVEALQMEVDLAEAKNSYDMALVDETTARNNFKEEIGLDITDSVKLISDFKYDVVIVDPEKAVKMALANRLELKQQEIQIQIDKMNVRQQKAQGMIRTNLTGYYQKTGISSQDLNSTFVSSLKNSYNDFLSRPQNFGIGITLNVPILDWGENKSLVHAAESRLKQAEIQKETERRNIESDIRSMVANLNSSLKRLQLLEKNVSIAEQSFTITRQRYADGDIDSQALALERDRLNTAYTNHLNAYIRYQLLLADLMRKTFYNFKTNQMVK